jgi:hypothetical protein
MRILAREQSQSMQRAGTGPGIPQFVSVLSRFAIERDSRSSIGRVIRGYLPAPAFAAGAEPPALRLKASPDPRSLEDRRSADC